MLFFSKAFLIFALISSLVNLCAIDDENTLNGKNKSVFFLLSNGERFPFFFYKIVACSNGYHFDTFPQTVVLYPLRIALSIIPGKK